MRTYTAAPVAGGGGDVAQQFRKDVSPSAPRLPVDSGALMLEAAEHLAEVVRVGEAPVGGDLLQRGARRDERARRLADADLGHEARGRQTRPRAEVVAEVAAAHPAFGGDRIDTDRRARVREHPASHV